MVRYEDIVLLINRLTFEKSSPLFICEYPLSNYYFIVCLGFKNDLLLFEII